MKKKEYSEMTDNELSVMLGVFAGQESSAKLLEIMHQKHGSAVGLPHEMVIKLKESLKKSAKNGRRAVEEEIKKRADKPTLQ